MKKENTGWRGRGVKNRLLFQSVKLRRRYTRELREENLGKPLGGYLLLFFPNDTASYAFFPLEGIYVVKRAQILESKRMVKIHI